MLDPDVKYYLRRLAQALSEFGLNQHAVKVSNLIQSNGLTKSASKPFLLQDRPEPTTGDTELVSTSPDESNSLQRGSGDSHEIKNLQRLLVRAGFPLPRFGVDGKFGEETEAALLSFKRREKEGGKLSGSIDGIVSSETLDLLKTYSEVSAGTDSESPSSDVMKEGEGDSGRTLYLGDSQMKGAIGNALTAHSGPGRRLSKVGSRASFWADHSVLIESLKSKPSKVIVSLGGNGINGTEALIKTLREHLPEDTPLVWTGAPPPQYKEGNTKTWAKYLTTAAGFDRAYNKRIKDNKSVASMVNSVKNWRFINPYDHIKYPEPLTVNEKQYASGYICEGCDGIHVPKAVAEQYVSNISALV